MSYYNWSQVQTIVNAVTPGNRVQYLGAMPTGGPGTEWGARFQIGTGGTIYWFTFLAAQGGNPLVLFTLSNNAQSAIVQNQAHYEDKYASLQTVIAGIRSAFAAGGFVSGADLQLVGDTGIVGLQKRAGVAAPIQSAASWQWNWSGHGDPTPITWTTQGPATPPVQVAVEVTTNNRRYVSAAAFLASDGQPIAQVADIAGTYVRRGNPSCAAVETDGLSDWTNIADLDIDLADDQSIFTPLGSVFTTPGGV